MAEPWSVCHCFISLHSSFHIICIQERGGSSGYHILRCGYNDVREYFSSDILSSLSVCEKCQCCLLCHFLPVINFYSVIAAQNFKQTDASGSYYTAPQQCKEYWSGGLYSHNK
jgi:hypothetical protein